VYLWFRWWFAVGWNFPGYGKWAASATSPAKMAWRFGVSFSPTNIYSGCVPPQNAARSIRQDAALSIRKSGE
jgi:hypothetical protein